MTEPRRFPPPWSVEETDACSPAIAPQPRGRRLPAPVGSVEARRPSPLGRRMVGARNEQPAFMTSTQASTARIRVGAYF